MYEIDLAWPAEQVAVLFEADAERRAHLESPGWNLLDPDLSVVGATIPRGGEG